jgi:hypothetical protein
MGIINLKIRIALLWVSVAVITVANSVYELMQRDFMEETFGEAFGGTVVTNISPIFVLVPLVMAILTVSLKDRGSRLTNIVVGIIWTLDIVGFLIGVIMTKYVPLIILNIVAVVALVMICIYALRWPRYE